MKSILTLIIIFFMMPLGLAIANQQLKVTKIPKESFLYPLGRMYPEKWLHLAIGLPVRNKTQRDQFLQDLYDPKSPDYRHYLTPQEFTQRFGPPQADYDTVVTFFRNKGFKVTTSPGRTLLDVDGTVKMIEATFHTTLSLYKHPTEGRNFYAPNNDPSVDLDIPLLDVSGLDNYVRIHPAWGNHPHLKELSSAGVNNE